MRNYKIIISASLIGLMIALAGCYYDEVLPEDLKTPDNVPEVVSFADDIIPIFNQSCNYAGCHNTGGAKPDLSPANAYNALFDGNYIDTDLPENSELYQWMRGNRSIPMPIEGANAADNALVIAWIRQGAENN